MDYIIGSIIVLTAPAVLATCEQLWHRVISRCGWNVMPKLIRPPHNTENTPSQTLRPPSAPNIRVRPLLCTPRCSTSKRFNACLQTWMSVEHLLATLQFCSRCTKHVSSYPGQRKRLSDCTSLMFLHGMLVGVKRTVLEWLKYSKI